MKNIRILHERLNKIGVYIGLIIQRVFFLYLEKRKSEHAVVPDYVLGHKKMSRMPQFVNIVLPPASSHY